jgi:hypothetical protein
MRGHKDADKSAIYRNENLEHVLHALLFFVAKLAM